MMTAWGEMTLGAWIWMAVWVIALLAMVWFLVGGAGRRDADDPDRILRRRFASGEISSTEFEQAQRLLHAEKETGQ